MSTASLPVGRTWNVKRQPPVIGFLIPAAQQLGLSSGRMLSAT
jgi:hypothetical protein